MAGNATEINYVIEQKRQTTKITSIALLNVAIKKLMQCIRLGFSKVSYCQPGIFDLYGWKQYRKMEVKLKN
jgi:hypothetical protein